MRDLAGDLGKQVLVDIAGSDVELDREMVEIIRDPLTHIVRNAIDHGIEAPAARRAGGKPEAGLLSISARQTGNQILIDILDDGRGIDDARLVEKAIQAGTLDTASAGRLTRRERFDLMFAPGLSTAETVTAISGRGVGMDVVRANIERIGGTVEIDSTPGEGTRMTLRVPLTLSIIPALTVGIDGQRFAIPRSSVEEIVHLAEGTLEIDEIGGSVFARIRQRRLPCLMAHEVLQLGGDRRDLGRPVLVLRLASGALFALMVDDVFAHEELVIKPAAPCLIATGLFVGTTLTDDGRPILLLEVGGLARAGGLAADLFERRARDVEHLPEERVATTKVIIFTGLDGHRRAIPMAVLDRIEQVDASAIERHGPRAFVVVRDAILPLAGLGGPEDALPRRLRLLSLSDGTSQVAYAIHEAHELHEIDSARLAEDASGEEETILLINGEAVRVLSAYHLFAAHARTPSRTIRRTCALPADDRWIQDFVRPMVEAAGYAIVEPDGADEPDLAICSASAGAPPRAREIICLLSEPANDPGAHATRGHIYRYDHKALLGAIDPTARRA